jgi:4-hydroxy-tetrahydrodipicolinate reductase
MTPKTKPKWSVQNCYLMTVRGNPQIMNRHMILPAMESGQRDWSDPAYMASIGMTITGMPALNAVGPVCDAKPGLITSADLPLRAFAGRFHGDFSMVRGDVAGAG